MPAIASRSAHDAFRVPDRVVREGEIELSRRGRTASLA